MRLYLGTSGFGYAEWAGKFYPKGLAPDRRLAYYAEQFNATEINSSFYAMPRPSVLESWAGEVPKRFSFSFKAPGEITHLRRLSGAETATARFVEAVGGVGRRLGILIFQLPPTFRKDAERLGAFLKTLPRGPRYAFEFRHPSWFDEETLGLLRRRKAALCVNDADVRGCPLEATAPWGVVKLRRVLYTRRELAAWARRIRSQPWREAHVFFKHEETASGPRLAARFAELFGT